jgi:hypothetical protein
MRDTVDRAVIPMEKRAATRPVMKLISDYKIRGRAFRVVMYWYLAGTCPYPGGHYDHGTGMMMCQWVIDSSGAATLAEKPSRNGDVLPRSSGRGRPRHRVD